MGDRRGVLVSSFFSRVSYAFNILLNFSSASKENVSNKEEEERTKQVTRGGRGGREGRGRRERGERERRKVPELLFLSGWYFNAIFLNAF